MADHPLRAAILWPIVLIVGLAIVGILIFAAFGYIAYRLDRHRSKQAWKEWRDVG